MEEKNPLESAYVQIRLRWGVVYGITFALLFFVQQQFAPQGDPLRPVYAAVFLVTVTQIFAAVEWYLHERANKDE